MENLVNWQLFFLINICFFNLLPILNGKQTLFPYINHISPTIPSSTYLTEITHNQYILNRSSLPSKLILIGSKTSATSPRIEDLVMPYRIRENLFLGSITDSATVLQNGGDEIRRIKHILSVLSSVSISSFTTWRSDIEIPAKHIEKVHVGHSFDGGKSCLSPDDILYSKEYAGKDLKLVRMAVPLKDTESENLLDRLEVCLDFIERSRKDGSILVHCFAGVSRSASIIVAYLMKSEHLSRDDALKSLRQSCNFICPNDGFLSQLKMFEEMGCKVDRDSPIYKRFRLKVLKSTSTMSFCQRLKAAVHEKLEEMGITSLYQRLTGKPTPLYRKP